MVDHQPGRIAKTGDDVASSVETEVKAMHVLSMLTLLALATPLQAQDRCKFSVIAERPTSIDLRGSVEVLRAFRIVDQPDLPLAIISLDVSRVTLGTATGKSTMSGPISVELMNISDVPVTRVEIGQAAGWRDSSISGRWSFGTRLAPGERRSFTLSVRSGRSLPDDLTTLIGVDAVLLEQCRYEPSLTPASAVWAQRRQ
jgi:hypothetical protein